MSVAKVPILKQRQFSKKLDHLDLLVVCLAAALPLPLRISSLQQAVCKKKWKIVIFLKKPPKTWLIIQKHYQCKLATWKKEQEQTLPARNDPWFLWWTTQNRKNWAPGQIFSMYCKHWHWYNFNSTILLPALSQLHRECSGWCVYHLCSKT